MNLPVVQMGSMLVIQLGWQHLVVMHMVPKVKITQWFGFVLHPVGIIFEGFMQKMPQHATTTTTMITIEQKANEQTMVAMFC